MAYSFNKLSFVFGALLIGLIVVQTAYEPMKYTLKADEVQTTITAKLNEKVCQKQDIPEIYQQVEKMVLQFNVQIALMGCVGSVLLAFLFSLLPQKGFFMWFVVRLFTILFVVTAVFFGVYVAIQPSVECESVKKIVTTPCTGFDVEKIKNNPYVVEIIKKIPGTYVENIEKFITMFRENIEKLGVTAPIFVIVIAFYLMNNVTKDVTKCSIAFLISLIISITTAFNFFNTTHDIILSIALPIIATIIVVVLVNLAITFGYAFVIPKYLLSAIMIAMRVGHFVEAFKLPICGCIVSGSVLIFLILNVFFWTQGKGYLTIIFLLNYGIQILYPLPVESLVILVFVVQVFVAVTEKKVVESAKETKVEEVEKPKQD